jgi:hypothetical protein
MIVLEASDLHWINTADDRDDQCAHGCVQFKVDDVIWVRPEDGNWTVSGAGLFLLRTIEHDHFRKHPVAENNFLFPCCAHSCWAIGEGKFKLMCMGCNRGIDVEVEHVGDSVELGGPDGTRKLVRASEWQSAVFRFADQVRGFYDRSSPKTVPDDPLDREGWAEFWKEWNSRRFGPGQK